MFNFYFRLFTVYYLPYSLLLHILTFCRSRKRLVRPDKQHYLGRTPFLHGGRGSFQNFS